MNAEKQYQQQMVESFNWRYQNQQDSWSTDPWLRATAVKLNELLGEGRRRVLDIGVGAAKPAEVLLQAGHQVCGIDIFAHQDWDALRAQWQGALELYKGDFNTWDFAAAQFDAVMDNGCMHHQHPNFYVTYLTKVQRLLKAGAYLVLNVYADLDDAALEGKITFTDHERICKYFTGAEIDGLLAKAGFNVLSHQHLYRKGLNEYYLLVVAQKTVTA
ncbi:methyltransferase family protein [Idiomarina loihiensis]|uniref:class I SAM-dependent methyltransferase n=1 Tax=Idiomarina TaxID=135575 RepID=UPI000D71D1A0|nr:MULTISPECIES: class I SAM-dependent methyltransferase [Idiomarina]PWW40322.1 methyltransferase family protein [Idiomarina loihiensis]TDP50013.1 methyltransferase family protein [Idiomarina loihiensis]TDS24635.1 methyltransferase family protein [Idiomarina sp. H2]